MTFTLHIDIAGLCLLVRRPTELLILLPHTPENTAGHEHKHLAVIASDRVYQPDRQPQHGCEVGDCILHQLGGGEITFGTDLERPYLDTDSIPAFDVHDIAGCAKTHVDPSKAFIKIHIPHGAPFTKHPGAHWKPNGNTNAPAVPMATRLTWSIRGLRNTVGPKPGLPVRITPVVGAPYSVILRPTEADRLVRMHLFHTLADELPCAPPPRGERLEVDTPARHFHHFFDLLTPGNSCKAPLFSHAGASSLVSGKGIGLGELEFQKGVARARPSADAGRRYSCVMATTTE